MTKENTYNKVVQEIFDNLSYMSKELVHKLLYHKESETSHLIAKMAVEIAPKIKQANIKYNE